MNKKIFSVFIVFFSFLILSYRLPASFIFHPDFARDMFDITRITQGKPMLVGPKLTFGGIYSGPFYYYLFVPIALLFNHNISAILYFNTFLFALSLGIFFYVLSQKFSPLGALLGTSALLFSPLYLTVSRNPSNAFTYLPFLLIFLISVYFFSIQKPKQLLLFGVLAGIICTFHVVAVGVIFFSSLILLIQLKLKRRFTWFLLGFPIAVSPLILFEIKHSFVMLKNTFIDKSYLLWINNSNIPGGITGKKNPVENFFFIADTMKKFSLVNPILLSILGLYGSVRRLFQRIDVLLILASAASLLLLAVFMRFQFIYHYLFATILLLLFTSIVLLVKHKGYVLLLIFIAFELANIPMENYLPSWRVNSTYEQAALFVMEHKLLSKGESFNIIQITEPDLLSPNGFEYRFYLQKMGYKLDSEFAYKTSPKLLIFSEKPEYDIKKLSTWESREFGVEHLAKAKKYKSGKITIYVTEKY